MTHINCIYRSKTLAKNIRYGADLGAFDGEADDDDNVELEKSNVLLMGSTGSVRHLQPFTIAHIN
jgi:ATP-dependent protease Clp ATPase subunit